ncbi:unnamed protein product [Penicillium salamii]|nr:unnamed protein product [Penicillium salamii]CAG8318054.1 unnamed protein product [Penicillium salamii]
MENTLASSGWVQEPDGRGTWSILCTCTLTTILCCWSSVAPNLPAKGDGEFRRWRYKFDLACLSVLGSEFILMVALGQWSSARRSVKDFHDAGYKDWSIKHAWFADMGGFLLDHPGDEVPSFPVDAKQLCALVKDGYVVYPALEEEEIEDKSKSGGLAKLFAIAQACWFTLNCLFRFAQGIFVTTLEVTTLSFILVFLVTSFCWYHKPMDVNRPITLELTAPIDMIRKNYDQADSPWYETPFDFLSRDEWFIARFWKYYIQILHYMHIPLFTRPERRPYDRIPSHYGPNVDTRAEILCTPTVLLFSSVFLIAWNSEYPTQAEQTLWRIASASIVAFTIGGGLTALYFHRTIFKADSKQGIPAIPNKEREPHHWIRRFALSLRNIDPEQDPALEIPLRALVPISLACVLYVLGRGFILIEDLIGLRDLPKSAFQTVSWSKYVPHW